MFGDASYLPSRRLLPGAEVEALPSLHLLLFSPPLDLPLLRLASIFRFSLFTFQI
jgi:hypothetical protein